MSCLISETLENIYSLKVAKWSVTGDYMEERMNSLKEHKLQSLESCHNLSA